MRRWAWLLTLALALPAGAAGVDEALERFRDGRFGEAEALLTEALETDADDLPARYWRARCHAAQEQWSEAVSDYRAVLRAKPDSQPSRLGLAEAYERMGRDSQAVAEYRKVLQQEPAHAEALAAVARLEQARSDTARPLAVAESAGFEDTAMRRAVGGRAPLGPRVGIDTNGIVPSFSSLLTDSALDAEGAQLLDYTFGSAPTDWEPRGGVWAVASRFACDPSWSFFGGHSQGLAAVWNKRRFSGDLLVEAYVSFKHGLPWNKATWSYRPSDLCMTLFGDGENPSSGYSFVYAGDNGSRTMILRGSEVLAETRAPEFLTPSYNDVKPSTEDFHRRWWRLEAQKSGTTLVFRIDGKEALRVEDAEPLDAGQIALWTVHNGMMVARVRVAYEHELRAEEPAVRVAQPAPLPDEATVVAQAR